MRHFIKTISFLTLTIPTISFAATLSLSSQDITHGEFMSKTHEFNGFGCSGDDLSPQLSWKNIPEGTKSFAITAYDPDAPTGSGWWHWQVLNIPVSINEIPQGAGNNQGGKLNSSLHNKNDYGSSAFGGACPPKGHGVHHYRFTIHALSVEKIELPEDASGALAGYMINANTIESSTIVSLYKRD